jgi:penicillin amidase
MLMADVEGGVGQLMAVRLPSRPTTPVDSLVTDIATSDAAWARLRGPLELPSVYTPAGGLLVSTNNPPFADVPVLVSRFFSSDDRQARLLELLGPGADLSAAGLLNAQLDSRSPQSREAVALLLTLAPAPAGDDFASVLGAWDGDFAIDSRGALAAVVLLRAVLLDVYTPEYGAELAARMPEGPLGLEILLEDLRAGAVPADVAAAAMEKARREWERHHRDATWGDRHRLAIDHPFSNIPLVGGRYRWGNHPVPGAFGTVWKSAADLDPNRHQARYGQNARAVFDLADPEENHFVILGGQDGWMRSPNQLDQVEDFLAGRARRRGMAITDDVYTHPTTVRRAAVYTASGSSSR